MSKYDIEVEARLQNIEEANMMVHHATLAEKVRRIIHGWRKKVTDINYYFYNEKVLI